jgi:hypothetical protein
MQTATPLCSTSAASAKSAQRAGLVPTMQPIAVSLLAPQSSLGLDQDRGFVALLQNYKDCGGLGRGDEVADQFKTQGRGVSQLARWIVEHHVISFDFRGEIWMPWFQFDHDMLVKADVRQVVDTFSDNFDGLHLARWFAEPNCWLDDRKPQHLLTTELAEVLHAARTDRFVAQG